VVPRWLAAFAAGEQPIIYGDGSASRDFCPVAGVVDANLLAACAPEAASGRVYNVALGSRTTLTELFELLREAMAQRGAPCKDTEAHFMPPREGDIPHSHADISRAASELGYAPRVDLQDGLERAAAWVQQNG
jgi:UDP-N-acetylglucosamine 4-epimerase